MADDFVHIAFHNLRNPGSEFDMMRLEELYRRSDLTFSLDKLHIVEFYILILIREGKGKHTIDFTEYEYEKVTVITVRKDQIHKFHFSEDAIGCLLIFTDQFISTYFEENEGLSIIQLFNELLGDPKLQLNPKEQEDIFSIVDRISTEYFVNRDEHSVGIIKSEVHILISKLFTTKTLNTNTQRVINKFN